MSELPTCLECKNLEASYDNKPGEFEYFWCNVEKTLSSKGVCAINWCECFSSNQTTAGAKE